MIGKVPRAGRGFRGLVAYLLRGPKDRVTDDRVAWSATRNLVTDDPEQAWRLMEATSKLSRRVRSPVYHYVISWHHDEAPSEDLMREVADTTCGDLGLSEHQLLYIAHADTKHRHVHIVANRVHAETGVAWRTSHDYRTIEQSLRRQAEAHGLAIVPGRHSDPELFRDKGRRVRDPDFQRQRRAEQQLLATRWSQEHLSRHRDSIATSIAEAGSWAELEQQLAKDGFALVPKGQGLVVADETGSTKLSQLGKGVRLKALEQRFGKSFNDHAGARKLPDPDEATAWQNRAALKLTQEAVTFSFLLYRLGIMSRRELDQHLAEKERAEEAAIRDTPFDEQIAQAVGKALKPKKPEPPLQMPRQPSTSRPKSRRDRDRTR